MYFTQLQDNTMNKEEIKSLDDLQLSALLANVLNELKGRDLVGPYQGQARSFAGYVGRLSMARFADNVGVTDD